MLLLLYCVLAILRRAYKLLYAAAHESDECVDPTIHLLSRRDRHWRGVTGAALELKPLSYCLERGRVWCLVCAGVIVHTCCVQGETARLLLSAQLILPQSTCMLLPPSATRIEAAALALP